MNKLKDDREMDERVDQIICSKDFIECVFREKKEGKNKDNCLWPDGIGKGIRCWYIEICPMGYNRK